MGHKELALEKVKLNNLNMIQPIYISGRVNENKLVENCETFHRC